MIAEPGISIPPVSDDWAICALCYDGSEEEPEMFELDLSVGGSNGSQPKLVVVVVGIARDRTTTYHYK